MERERGKGREMERRRGRERERGGGGGSGGGEDGEGKKEMAGLGMLRGAGKNAFSESGSDKVHSGAGSSAKQECPHSFLVPGQEAASDLLRTF